LMCSRIPFLLEHQSLHGKPRMAGTKPEMGSSEQGAATNGTPELPRECGGREWGHRLLVHFR
jgi:hypothetical protein